MVRTVIEGVINLLLLRCPVKLVYTEPRWDQLLCSK